MKPLARSAVLCSVIRAAEGETTADDGTTLVVASTTSIDRMDDVIDQESWNLENYERNPVILWMHDPTRPPIGRAEVYLEKGALHAKISWDKGDPLGAEVARKFASGFLNAVSVGFRPGRSVSRKGLDPKDPRYKAEGYGFVYLDCDLLEISAVSVPANPDAVSIRTDGEDVDRIERLLQAVTTLQADVAAGRREVAEVARRLDEVGALVGLDRDAAALAVPRSDAARDAIIRAIEESGLLAS